MGRMTKAIYNLIKALIARPAKPQATNLHWVKANKPIGEMSPEERNNFSARLADEILKNIKDK